MGDLNCDMIATRYDNNTCKLMNITDIYGLQQLITEPTRITPTSATLIDVIYTNCPQWKCSFLSIVNKHAPLRTMRVRTRSSPWITSELSLLSRNQDVVDLPTIVVFCKTDSACNHEK